MKPYVRNSLYLFCLVLPLFYFNFHLLEYVTDAPLSNDREESLGTTWCPSATSCEVINSGCQPCRRRWLIIISTGRSASTTLTHQLWRLPGIHMGGENNNLLGNLHNAFLHTTNRSNYRKTKSGFGAGAWVHEPLSKEMLACSVQNAFEAINPPPINIAEDDLILGFKTIRLQHNKDLKAIVEFLQESFPCARFLVNYRSAEALKQSWESLDFTKARPGESLDFTKARAEDSIERLKQIGHLLPESQTRFLNSTQWTRNITVLNEVVKWMGYSEECYFTELLQYNTKRYEHSKTDLRIDPNCRYIG